MKEIWKDIKGYEGLYQISSQGRVKSLPKRIHMPYGGYAITKEIIMSTADTTNGYKYVVLSKNNKQKNILVHRLVATAFITNPDNLPEINHKDENKQNNCVDNLEFCTHKYNCNYGTRNKRAGDSHKGEKLSEEHKRKISEALTNNPKLSKHIFQIDPTTNRIIAEFPSSREVERILKYNRSNITACCRGEHEIRYGYKWKYAE